MREEIEDRRSEYDAHVWNHVDDAFQKSFDSRRPLTVAELEFIGEIVDGLRDGSADEALASAIRRGLRSDPELAWVLLQLVGLTRNKILTDLKSISAAADQGPVIPGRADRLASNDAAWELAGPYFASAARRTFQSLLRYEDRTGALEAVNQATWPGYIRQERAKRQGHEAEGRIAQVLFALRIPFEPAAKADNPLCPDAQIYGVSYDIVSPSTTAPVLVIKSTVQTANIGQFGESKVDLEIQEAQASLEAHLGLKKPFVVAFVDGVGFYSNTQGLHGALGGADEFAQFRTIWKIPVVAAAGLGIKIEIALPEADIALHRPFLDRHSTGVRVVALTEDTRARFSANAVDAGEAVMRRA